MSITGVIVIAVLICIFVLIIKNYHPTWAFVLSLSGAIVILLLTLPKISSVFHNLENLSVKSGIGSSLYKTLIKCFGVSYLTEFGADLCNDSGQVSLASKVILFGKITVIFLILPLVETILNNVISIIK